MSDGDINDNENSLLKSVFWAKLPKRKEFSKKLLLCCERISRNFHCAVFELRGEPKYGCNWLQGYVFFPIADEIQNNKSEEKSNVFF